MIIECNKTYINRRGEIYFDIERAYLAEDKDTILIYKARSINGYSVWLNEKGYAITNVSKNHKHINNNLDIIKEYNNSILLNVEILLRRLFV